MTIAIILPVLAALTCLALSLVVLLKETASPARSSFAGLMLLLGLEAILVAACVLALDPDGMIAIQRARLVVLSFLPISALLFTLSYARADPRESFQRWRIGIRALWILPPGVAILLHRNLFASTVLDEVSDTWYFILGDSGRMLYVCVLIGMVIALMNLERLLRAASGVMRWRIKYMVIGLGIVLATRLYTCSHDLLYSSTAISISLLDACSLMLGGVMIGVSLRRSHFQGAELYLSPTALYRSITLVAVGAYLLVAGLAAKIVSHVGGASIFPLGTFLAFLALAALAALLLSERLRLRTRMFVSRHLRRPRYDYRKVWMDFTARTTSQVELHGFCRSVVNMLCDTFQLLSATLWLTDTTRDQLVFGASTSLAGAVAREPERFVSGIAPLVEAMRKHPGPVDLDVIEDAWVDRLKAINPESFLRGPRVCVPLISGGEVLGLIALGDRVSGLPFLLEDFDLMKTVGDQVASNLLTFRLSERLIEARELEAFQSMSAFFVHDLKNTSSSLSLMLQNLPRHFENPEFRKDALRAMQKSVDRINDLVRRLTTLRQTLQLECKESDLNELIGGVLQGLSAPPDTQITRELQPLPRIVLDPVQMENVITNLVLNAQEAVAEEGHIRIATFRDNGWAVFSVGDDGCGMSAEFLQRSLFRPFRSTKKSGIGIGLFQSKMIVEAHGGKIEVESKEGEGSTMRVYLPVSGGT